MIPVSFKFKAHFLVLWVSTGRVTVGSNGNLLNCYPVGSIPATSAYQRIVMPLYGERKKEYQKEWIRKRREDFFFDKSCVRCSSKEDLELDHVDRIAKTEHRIWSWSKARREEEIAKCQILCSECHKIKSAKEVQELLTYDVNGKCVKNHPLELVGFYFNKNGTKGCSYCHHIARAIKRNNNIKTLEQWIEFRSK